LLLAPFDIDDWFHRTLRVGFSTRPALLIVDFVNVRVPKT
jgi:hypothetical protein